MSIPVDAPLRRLIEHVRTASDAKTALDICGGVSKAFYGNARRGEPLEMGELCGISSYEPTELVVTALAGTPLSEVEEALAQRGQCLPFEPPHFAPGGTVGGMVAAGLAGPSRASVGSVRDHVLGVTVLNGRGETLTFGGQVMKNVAGYDVSRVFCGSMGVLGVICEVSLKVMPVAAACATLQFDLDEATAIAHLNRWSAEPCAMNASSWFEGCLRVRLSGARAAIASLRERLGGIEIGATEAVAWWAEVCDQRLAYFQMSPEAMDRGECLWRLALPDTTPPLALPGETFIEWGGAQRWLRSTAAAMEIRAAAAGAGGHATLMRAADKSPGAFSTPSAPIMNIHRRLKKTFDPAGIFNSGRLFADL